MKTQNEDNPDIVYNNEQLEVVESFKYFGIEVLSNHKWNKCNTCHLQVKKRSHYLYHDYIIELLQCATPFSK